MRNENDWIVEQVAKIDQRDTTQVPEPVVSALQKLLSSASERQLTKGELAKVAQDLILGMKPARRDVEGKVEN